MTIALGGLLPLPLLVLPELPLLERYRRVLRVEVRPEQHRREPQVEERPEQHRREPQGVALLVSALLLIISVLLIWLFCISGFC
jgi:hypothetical protein